VHHFQSQPTFVKAGEAFGTFCHHHGTKKAQIRAKGVQNKKRVAIIWRQNSASIRDSA
jgi:hypothetical protein